MVLDPNGKEKVMVVKEGHSLAMEMEKSFPKFFGKQLGKLIGFEHDTLLKQIAVPKVHKVRSVPIMLRDDVSKELDKLMQMDVIEPIESSEWISPVIIARRSNGKIHLCIDLRYLNNKIVIDHFLLPKSTEMVSSLKGAHWFSTIGLSAAYHQIPLSAKSKKLTAFITPFGSFQYKRVPFGLASAAAVFQRLMYKLFGKFKEVMCFQDDILVFGEDRNVHDGRLRHVLEVLESKGLKVELSKCKFTEKSVEYLGHEFSGERVKPKVSLVDAIVNAPTPTTKANERSRSFWRSVSSHAPGSREDIATHAPSHPPGSRGAGARASLKRCRSSARCARNTESRDLHERSGVLLILSLDLRFELKLAACYESWLMACGSWRNTLPASHACSIGRDSSFTLQNAAPDAAESEPLFRPCGSAVSPPGCWGNANAGNHSGNPDIRVPERTSKEDGLCARAQKKEKTPTTKNREEKTRNTRAEPGTAWFP
ncbi:hypothetical protein NDU88_010309 [Pleurodeles waltl]|uniref:ribonuclease H n=1 Tax=Pleurodeles waltl TaxID=8319 RepID=A0AAV7PXP3_PLEWA|nr:hypothetical protein NDU88_010309 [Pleurodeles waltl]